MSRKTVLIDGNSLVYRAFYALPTSLTLQSGQVTNAVYGFTSMLIRLLIDEEPDVVAVAFDTRAPTWRHERYVEYKAHREATPDELISQLPLVKEILAALNIPVFELPGYEADDILATLATKGLSGGDDVLVVTSDKDAFQLVSDDGIRVMTTRKGITDIVIYDCQKVEERYGITPEQVPDFLGLKGDSSDNIPGVPGVGDKTAAKLLQQFGTVEGIYAAFDDVKGARLRHNLDEYKEQALISKELAVLVKDLPMELADDLRLGEWDVEEVREVFTRLEFRTLFERFEANLGGVGHEGAPFLIEIKTENPEDSLLKTDAPAAGVGIAPIRDSAGKTTGWAIVVEKDEGFLAWAWGEPKIPDGWKDWLANPSSIACINDLKQTFKDPFGLDDSFTGQIFDPMIAAYLLEPGALSYELEQLTRRYLRVEVDLTSGPKAAACQRAAAALALKAPLQEALEQAGLTPVYEEIELPLIAVLARVETTGIGIDRRKLDELSSEFGAEIKTIAARIYNAAGEEFNINSPQQVSKILFEKLGLTPLRKTRSKGAYATDAAVLNKLAEKHEIVPLILSYRELAKLKSTYIDALPKMINPATKRLHTTFNQTVAATGRLSSSDPNLQNIPTRSKLGRHIREAFVPPHRNDKLLSADYSQIELRLLAHISKDQALTQAFSEGIDIHATTAAEVFGIPAAEVTPEQRRRAKAINFGIVYGQSPYGLAQQLDISQDEAKDYIELYFSRYPQVKEYMDRTIKEAHRDGQVKTLTGRVRPLPELKSANYNQRSFAERAAINAPLQGTAADIIKIAMIDIDRWLRASGLQTRMVLQVHDELIFEVPPLEEAVVVEEVEMRMRGAYELSVPLEVNLAFGSNWGEAK